MEIGDCSIKALTVHRVGNQARSEPLQLSDRTPVLDETVCALLIAGYLDGIISAKNRFQLFHESDLRLNEIYQYTRQFFNGEIDFVAVSQRIARHLYAQSQHPNIRAGDLFVIAFDGLTDGDRSMRALGIFKAEIRDEVLTIIESADTFDISHVSGINPRLIDKGALILEHGPAVYAIDRQGTQTKFWLDDFLKAMRVPDTASKSRMMGQALQALTREMEDPVAQSGLKEACLALCEDQQTVSTGQVMSLAGKFAQPEQVASAFGAAADACGMSLDDAADLPAAMVAKRLQRTLSRFGVGHGVSVLLPAELALQNIQSVAGDGEILTLTLRLKRRF